MPLGRARGGRNVGCGVDAGESGNQIVGGRKDLRGFGCTGVRHLREGEILGEADGRQALDRAAEDREERATGGVRPPRAAIEPGVDAGPLERVLDQAQVLARRAEEDRNLVEADAARTSSRIRRAISTHSRPSPGAEKSRTSPWAARSGGCRVAKSERRSAARSESPDGTSVSIETSKRFEVMQAWRGRRTAP